MERREGNRQQAEETGHDSDITRTEPPTMNRTSNQNKKTKKKRIREDVMTTLRDLQ